MMSAMDRRAGMPQLPLRSPVSLPMFKNVTAGPGRDSQPMTGNLHHDIRALAAGDLDLNTRNSTQPIKKKQHMIAINNSLVVGNDPVIFNTIKPQTRPTSCHNCGLFGSQKCSQCHITYYCSVECQRLDWKAHSLICKPEKKKVTNGEEVNKSGEAKAFTKVPCTPISSSRDAEEDGRRVMLCDLKVETLKEGAEIKGYVSEFSSPSSFFVQEYNAKLVENLMKLSALLNKIYSSPENMRKDYVAAIGEVCAAKYSQDQQWYRALVYNMDMNTAQVLYLDYGNKETLSLCDLQPMHRDVDLVPPCAMNVRVAHVHAPPCGWSPECLVDVKRLLTGQQILVRIVHVAQEELPRYSAEVTLLESGKLLHKVMEEKGFSFISHSGGRPEEDSEKSVCALKKSSEEAVEKQKQPYAGRGSPDTQGKTDFCAGDRFEALITVFHNPEMFYCQQVKNAKQLGELVAVMNKRCNAMTTTLLSLPGLGEVCCAQYTADTNWYRASIEKYVSDDTVLVRYLDFGNTESLHVSRLRPIEADMLLTPFQATKCCLAGVKPPSGTWSSEAAHAIGLILINKVFTAVVVSESAGILTLDLIAESATPPVVVSQHLISAGLAEADKSASIYAQCVQKEEEMPREPPSQLAWAQLPLGQEMEVMVCMLLSPEEFFCHIYKPTDLNYLKVLNMSLGQYCRQHMSEGYTPNKGDVCGAFFSDDGNWYRGQVKDFTSSGAVMVHFLDYGNTKDVLSDKLCKLPSSFLELPFQAVECSLAGVKPPGEKWDLRATVLFQKSVAGIKLRAKALSRKGNGYLVQLVVSESGKAITDLLLAEKVAISEEPKTDGANVRSGRSTEQKADKVSSLVHPLQEHGVTSQTEDLPGRTFPSRGPMGSSLQEPYSSSHPAPPDKSAQLALQKTNLAKGAPIPATESISCDTTTMIHSGSAAPYLPRGLNSGYSTPSFNTKCNPNPKGVSPANATFGTYRESSDGPRAFRPAVCPPSLPSRSESSKGDFKGKNSPSSPLEKATSVSHPQLSPAKSPPQSNGSKHPSWKEKATGDVTQSNFQASFSASQSASSMCADLPDSAVPAKQQSPAFLEGVSTAQSWASVDLPLNEPLAARVLKVKSPDLLYVFPKQNRVDVEKLQQVMADMFSYCNAETDQPDYRPSVGDVCCAKFTEDGQWYRAVVLDVLDSTVEIAYADFGNLETLPFCSLRAIKESFLCPPMQITRCRIYGLAPETYQWSPEKTQTLSNLLLGADVALTALSVEAGVYTVSMGKKHGADIVYVGEKLLKECLAKFAETGPSADEYKEKDDGCYEELKKRVEKLELLLEKVILHLNSVAESPA